MNTHNHTELLDAEKDLAKRVELDGPLRLDKKAVLASLPEKDKSHWFGKWLGSHFGPGKLSVDEFLFYGLYDASISSEQCRKYLGKQAQNRLHYTCNDSRWFAPTHNKLLMQMVLDGARLPTARLLAAFLKYSATGSDAVLPLSPDSLAEFLESHQHFPVFAKPIEGMYSLGVMRIDQYQDGQVTLSDGRRVSVDELCTYMRAMDEKGYIVQEVLKSHQAITTTHSAGLGCVRVMALLNDSGPGIHWCTLKLPSGHHDADNAWRAGNCLAAVDSITGTLAAPVTQTVNGAVIVGENDDFSQLEGSTLPDWPALRDLVERAAVLFPDVRTQGWDVAVTEAGPVLLELNFGGDLILHQMAHQCGVLDDTYAQHIKDCGYKGKLA